MPNEVTPEVAEITPAEEVPTEAATEVEKTEAPTISEIVKEATPEKVDTVPLSVFLELKKELKEEQRKKTETPAQRATNLDAIADKYNVDKDFLNDISAVLKAETEAELRPLKEKEKQAQIDAAFSKHFTAALADMPEYEGMVNPDVIKTLSLDPKNANKTFKQIIEDTYSTAISGKRTIESTKPGGGKESQPLDFARAKKDSEYFDEVMADPKLKAEYNAQMLVKGF